MASPIPVISQPFKKHQVFAAFWIFGLLNNVLYVVILSAAIDLVGALVPKATVLLADVLPSLLVKIAAPFFIQLIPYNYKITVIVALDILGMLTIVYSDNTSWKLFGIVLASLSSGLGEVSFLQLTHYYTNTSLKAFSSGTGGAGLVGSFTYFLMTTVLGVSVKISLLVFTVVPFIIIFDFFWLLPTPVFAFDLENNGLSYGEIEDNADNNSGSIRSLKFNDLKLNKESFIFLKKHVANVCRKLELLIVPFMIPLTTVYIAEYIINQGISPTLLFSIDKTPFKKYRDLYVAYGTLYQLGVFISRSSASFYRIKRLYIPSLLQFINLAICFAQSLFMIIPNVNLVLLLMFYEGLLGGASYVNTFMLVTESVDLENREFAMGAVGVSDSFGIVVAACISMWLEPKLCQFQVSDGRPWCRME
ncbi:hypothetical protein PACTADRAFT_1640 [Pachysolen tannophilus NRRL Y-2460]|uniref:Protein BTN n=1 Tax=Pachysolen tannophilus NRRL Y-2460 TaxID=669874 RepID=A0A1E4TZF3_PACTA|nr:hypothetical protein PACTADRAFT_1640 [Pachysolen tannophilus NRRL Y-2460]